MLDKLNRLIESHGAMRRGHGLVSGVIALSLATLSFLGVLAFHFPEYLTTPQLRKSYNVDVMRQLLYWALVLAGGIALFNICFGRVRWLSLGAFVLIALTLALGGHTPNFHRWHHTQDDEAIDRNDAAPFAFIHHLFGTAVQSDRQWPNRYGVVADCVPNGFWKQLALPFVWNSKA